MNRNPMTPTTPIAVAPPAGISSATLIISETEAAKMLCLSVRTIQRLRLEGGGPRFVKLTGRRVGYTIGDIQTWVRARSVANTAPTPGAA